MSKLFTTICISLLVVTFSPSIASADPIEITSGFVSVLRLRGPTYNLVGLDFVATGGAGEHGNTGPDLCSPCRPGDIIPLNSLYAGSSLGLGTAIVNGNVFPNLIFSGVFEFTGDPLVIPDSVSNVVLTAPFSFSGFLAGCLHSDPSCQTPVFTTELMGSGVSRVELTRHLDSQGRAFFEFVRVTHVFGPIPEPTSLLLLTSGLAAIGAAKLKRRRRGSKTRSRD